MIARIVGVVFFILFGFSCTPLRFEGPLKPAFLMRPLPPSYELRSAKYLGKFKVSFYWLVEEERYSGKKSTPLYTTEGKLLGYFPADFVKDLKIESCAKLRDGRIISYLKKQNRVKITDKPLGYGYKLTTLKSVAVDPEIIRLGSTLYIPKVSGLKINQTEVHNGIFYAHDIGSAIKGYKIDIFLGFKSNKQIFISRGIKSADYVEVYLLE